MLNSEICVIDYFLHFDILYIFVPFNILYFIYIFFYISTFYTLQTYFTCTSNIFTRKKMKIC